MPGLVLRRDARPEEGRNLRGAARRGRRCDGRLDRGGTQAGREPTREHVRHDGGDSGAARLRVQLCDALDEAAVLHVLSSALDVLSATDDADCFAALENAVLLLHNFVGASARCATAARDGGAVPHLLSVVRHGTANAAQGTWDGAASLAARALGEIAVRAEADGTPFLSSGAIATTLEEAAALSPRNDVAKHAAAALSAFQRVQHRE